MSNQYLRNKNYIYQIGDGRGDYFIIPRKEIVANVIKPSKSQYDENNFIDGQSRINLNDRNFLSAANLKLSFLVQDKDYFDLGYVKKVFQQAPQKTFFYTIGSNDSLRMFFNPSIDFVQSVQQEDTAQNKYGQQIEKVDVDLKASNPFVYECKTSIAYFDYDLFAIIGGVVYSNAGILYGAGGIYGSSSSLATILLSTLSIQERLDYFASCTSTKALVYTDKFFDRDGTGIEAGQEIIDVTLSNNNVNDSVTSTLYKDTTADNRTFIIAISGILNNAEWVSIQNTSNSSSLKFVWTSATPSPAIMYYNSYWDRVYDAAGDEIPPLNYRKERDLSKQLYFSPLATQNKTLTNEFENIRLQKTSVANITIRLENLNTYQL
jgi:hypothetical protein